MSYNKKILLENLLDQAALQLSYRLGLHESNNPLENSRNTRYTVKVDGETFTVYEPSAVKMYMQNPGKIEIISIEGRKDIPDYTTTSDVPSNVKH